MFVTKWICPKCNTPKPNVRKVAFTGAGITRILDLQHLEYYAVSCNRCGYTEFYDASVLRDKSRVMEVLDLLFG